MARISRVAKETFLAAWMLLLWLGLVLRLSAGLICQNSWPIFWRTIVAWLIFFIFSPLLLPIAVVLMVRAEKGQAY